LASGGYVLHALACGSTRQPLAVPPSTKCPCPCRRVRTRASPLSPPSPLSPSPLSPSPLSPLNCQPLSPLPLPATR
jgi:hypothetical protein